MIKQLLSNLSSLLQDGKSKQWSSTRFSLLLTVICSNVAVFGMWVIVCFMKKDIVDIPPTLMTLYSLANGITLTGKIAQKRQEVKENKTE